MICTLQPPVRDAAQGRWRSILPAFGVTTKALSGKHGPCPVCNTDKPKFRFDDKEGRGTWICTCGAGDGMALVMAITGLPFADAARRVEEIVGSAPLAEPKPERSERSKRDAMNALWRAAGPVMVGDPVSLWLRRRVGLEIVPRCIRSAPWVRYAGDPVTHHPCMVTMVTDSRGRPATLHRTYLTKDGFKAPVEDPRRLMSADLPPGSAVQLFPAADVMGIGEGIETAFAAASLFSIPVWAAINAANLGKWSPPAGVREVVIFGDNDPKYAGHAYSWQLAHRLACRGIITRVEIPGTPGQDWNDVLNEDRTLAA